VYINIGSSFFTYVHLVLRAIIYHVQATREVGVAL